MIINIGSGWGLVGGRNAASYCASKGAVVNLTRAMALDHAEQNIRVNCICPGDTDTAMLRPQVFALHDGQVKVGLICSEKQAADATLKSIAEEESKSFALKVMDFMRSIILKYQKETGQLFNLEATPAEGTSYRFAKIDKKRYPEIKVANEKDLGKDGIEPFYTNSTHLPVDYTGDLLEALDHQDELQNKYTGGTVFHGFLGESLPDTKSVKALVAKIANNYRLPYFTLTPTFSVCPKHGYLKGEWQFCPKCDKEIGYKEN